MIFHLILQSLDLFILSAPDAVWIEGRKPVRK